MWEHFTSKRYYGAPAAVSSSQPSSNPSLASSTSHTPSTTAHTTPSLSSNYQSTASPRTTPYSTSNTPSDTIRPIGEIYTPWPSWHIVARHPSDARNEAFLSSLDHGIAYFEAHQDEAVQYISTQLDYSAEDAQAWLRTVKFARETTGVKKSVVNLTVSTLRKANVLVDTRDPDETTRMIGITREESAEMR